MYFAFVYLEEVFDQVPRDNIWKTLRKLAKESASLRLHNQCIRMLNLVRVKSDFSDENVGLHQDSMLSFKLFIIKLQTLSREIWSGRLEGCLVLMTWHYLVSR